MKTTILALTIAFLPAVAPAADIPAALEHLDRATAANQENARRIKTAQRENAALQKEAKSAAEAAERVTSDLVAEKEAHTASKEKLSSLSSRVNRGMWWIAGLGAILGVLIASRISSMLPLSLRAYTWQIPVALALSGGLLLAIAWQAFFRL